MLKNIQQQYSFHCIYLYIVIIPKQILLKFLCSNSIQSTVYNLCHLVKFKRGSTIYKLRFSVDPSTNMLCFMICQHVILCKFVDYELIHFISFHFISFHGFTVSKDNKESSPPPTPYNFLAACKLGTNSPSQNC